MAVTRTTLAPPRTAPAGHDGSPGPVLAASLLGFFVIALDALVVTVALPDIGASLGGGMAGLQWVTDGYTLMFAALMLSAGALTDRIGARRAYAGGLVLFALSSAACGLAPGLGTMVGARLVQGAAAAVMMPASLALIRQAFTDQARRARAIAVWTAGGAVAAAAGPVAGGFLTSAWSWRAIFFINLPAAAAALLLLARTRRSPRLPAPVDWTGQLTAVLAMGALTYGVIVGGAEGFAGPRPVLAVLVAVAAGAAFVRAQARRAAPMVPLRLFRTRAVSVGVAVGFAVNAAFYGAVFVLSLYFQQARGLSPLHTGLLFLPMTALVAVVNLAAARVAARFGPRVPMAAGQLLAGAGLVALCLVDSGTPVTAVALLAVPVGLGGALTVPPMTGLVLDSVPAERAGTAAGVLNTSRQTGGALAVAVFGALLAGRESFEGGMRISMAAAAVTLAATAALTVGLLPSAKR
ncbi:MFS transporter [Streptomyces sp. NPDC051940]|uniref:MFS transporter n=1 Tax=Streptomyces sp. NPDC051940 TaxID=3155675 RepID=UPI00342F818E